MAVKIDEVLRPAYSLSNADSGLYALVLGLVITGNPRGGDTSTVLDVAAGQRHCYQRGPAELQMVSEVFSAMFCDGVAKKC